MSKTFDDRIALVTGGSTGIGAATAQLLADQGARVVVTGRREDALREVSARHPAISHVVADIAEPAQAARSVETVIARHGGLDVLINNAGILELAPLTDASLEHVRRTFEVNTFGLIETTRLALPHLARRRGAIVNLATVIADEPFGGMSVYCASKAAVLALTRAWAQELAGAGIRVNAVSPGPIETPMFSAEKLGIGAPQLEQLGAGVLDKVPVRRFGRPEEVAQVIAFLASPAASYVTGAQYTVGGGIEA